MIDNQPDDGDRLVPIVDSERCNRCGLCVQVCPIGALAIRRGRVVVARPAVCEYNGLCELICPTQAIQRPFVIVLAKDEQETRVNQASEHND